MAYPYPACIALDTTGNNFLLVDRRVPSGSQVVADDGDYRITHIGFDDAGDAFSGVLEVCRYGMPQRKRASQALWIYLSVFSIIHGLEYEPAPLTVYAFGHVSRLGAKLSAEASCQSCIQL
jgi:hypothetical protein